MLFANQCRTETNSNHINYIRKSKSEYIATTIQQIDTLIVLAVKNREYKVEITNFFSCNNSYDLTEEERDVIKYYEALGFVHQSPYIMDASGKRFLSWWNAR